MGRVLEIPDDDPVTPEIWRSIYAFLVDKKTGSVVLHVQDGNIRKLEVKEFVPLTSRA